MDQKQRFHLELGRDKAKDISSYWTKFSAILKTDRDFNLELGENRAPFWDAVIAMEHVAPRLENTITAVLSGTSINSS